MRYNGFLNFWSKWTLFHPIIEFESIKYMTEQISSCLFTKKKIKNPTQF